MEGFETISSAFKDNLLNVLITNKFPDIQDNYFNSFILITRRLIININNLENFRQGISELLKISSKMIYKSRVLILHGKDISPVEFRKLLNICTSNKVYLIYSTSLDKLSNLFLSLIKKYNLESFEGFEIYDNSKARIVDSKKLLTSNRTAIKEARARMSRND